MDEPACVLADRVVAAVTAPPVGPGDFEALLRRLLPTTPVQTPTELEIAGTSTVWSASTDADTAGMDWQYGSRNPGSQALDYDSVLFLWKTGLL